MVAPSATRVAENTPEHVQQEIHRSVEKNIAYYASRPQEIDERLRELDEEWDIDRMLERNAASLALGGAAMTLLFGRKWVVVPLVVSGFLLQYAVQGWCPPVSVLRRMGVRTRREIDEERFALKALRGDFRELPSLTEEHRNVGAFIDAIRR